MAKNTGAEKLGGVNPTAVLTNGELLALIPRVGKELEAPTARLREISRQLKMFAFSQAELKLLAADIALQLTELGK